MKITKDIIADLWPLYADGTASADTKTLIEETLRENPELRKSLQDNPTHVGEFPSPDIQPDQEVKMLNQIKTKARWLHGLLLLAMVFSMQAFGRIVADTTWTNSPRAFIGTAIVAGICWIAYIVGVLRIRRLGV